MAIGDIGALIESLQFETSVDTSRITQIKLSAGYVALFYEDGIKTYPVSIAGDIGAMIDSWDFAAGSPTYASYGSEYSAFAMNVSGNVYAVSYFGSGRILRIATMTISTTGTITKSMIASESFSALGLVWHLGGIIRKTGTNKYVVTFEENKTHDGHMAVFDIPDDGSSITLTDSWEFDTSNGRFPIVRYVVDDVFALVYDDYTNALLRTFYVSDAGAITKSFIHTENLSARGGSYYYLAEVYEGCFAVFWNNSRVIKTFLITNAGVITLVDTGVYYSASCAEIRPYRFKQTGGTSYFSYVARSGSWNGYAITLPITFEGNIGAVIDTITLVSGSFQYGEMVLEIQPSIFLSAWSNTPGVYGYITSFDIDSLPDIYPSDNIVRVSGIRHIYRPGIFRMLLSLGDVSNTIEIAEHKVRKELEIPEQRTPEPIVSGCEEGATSGKGTNKYTCIGGVWTHTPDKPAALEDLLKSRVEPPDYFPASAKVTAPQPPPLEISTEPTLWSKITPWKEEAGETFGGEIAERVKSFTDWIGGWFR